MFTMHSILMPILILALVPTHDGMKMPLEIDVDKDFDGDVDSDVDTYTLGLKTDVVSFNIDVTSAEIGVHIMC